MKEYRAVFSYPPSILGETPNSYSYPVDSLDKVPKHAPRSEETWGWRSGIQQREVTEWKNIDNAE